MAALPEMRSPTVEAIYASYEARAAQERRRGYLGGSEVGRECWRQSWYRFRWALRPAFEGRMLRLFDTGHREEPRIIEELKRIGVEVHEKDESTGKQWRFTALGGHFSGGLDGVARGILEAPKTWHLLEFKTANTKTFKRVKKDGVERAQPVHFAQMQVYMGLAKLTRAAYFVVCKETDELYFERVHFDRKAFDALIDRARQIITSPVPLTRASRDPFGPPCGFCEMRPLCHEEQLPEVNCRTCAHSTPLVDDSDAGAWKCERTGKLLSRQDQERACDEHIFIPALVPYAEAIDGDETYVLYQIRGKDQQFVNVGASGFPAEDVPHYGSRELRNVPKEAIGNEAVEEVRASFGAVTGGNAAPAWQQENLTSKSDRMALGEDEEGAPKLLGFCVAVVDHGSEHMNGGFGICGAPTHETPGGPCCENGHGGADYRTKRELKRELADRRRNVETFAKTARGLK